MKHRNGERVERRKASAELNLLGDGKARGVKGRSLRGCASMLGQVLVAATLLVVIMLGLR